VHNTFQLLWVNDSMCNDCDKGWMNVYLIKKLRNCAKGLFTFAYSPGVYENSSSHISLPILGVVYFLESTRLISV
jgi:hypothetical protein